MLCCLNGIHNMFFRPVVDILASRVQFMEAESDDETSDRNHQLNKVIFNLQVFQYPSSRKTTTRQPRVINTGLSPNYTETLSEFVEYEE